MSWGIDIDSLSGGFIIDQNFPGHYLDGNNPRVINTVNYTIGPPSSGMPYLRYYGDYFSFPNPGLGIAAQDIIFSAPTGPHLPVTSRYGYAGMTAVRVGSGAGYNLGHLSPARILHYKSLSAHPVAASGWGVVVYTPQGTQSFNSAAMVKRLDIVASGVTTPVPGGAPTHWHNVSRILTPSDSITNYYAMTSGKVMSWFSGPENNRVASGFAYEYDFTANAINVVGSVSVSVEYFIARVAG